MHIHEVCYWIQSFDSADSAIISDTEKRKSKTVLYEMPMCFDCSNKML